MDSNMLDYQDFLKQNRIIDEGAGFEATDLNPMLFNWQAAITKWAMHKGRVLVGANCGLGKGPIQLEFLKQAHEYTDQPVIMFCPPGVKIQFKNDSDEHGGEAAKFGYEVEIVAEDDDIIDGINITNYERLMVRTQVPIDDWADYCQEYDEHQPIELKRDDKVVYCERFRFYPGQFGAIALDEASILKHYGAKTRERLTRFAKNIPFRICATATPSPNDFMELINYADFLGIMNGKQSRAMFFIQDGNSSNKFRIKKPAWKPFWQWVASWAVVMEKPSDLGYDDNGYVLPELTTKVHVLKDENVPDGQLIAMTAQSLTEQSRVKRMTVEERCHKVAEIVARDPGKHYLIYVKRNAEGELLNKLIPNSVEVAGRHSENEKEDMLIGFAQGKYQILITKPEIGGFGLNLQGHCNHVISSYVDHSYEEVYQYIRRVWRFGQTKPVHHDIVAMDTEGDIITNQKRKERQAKQMHKEIVEQMDIHDLQKDHTKKSEAVYMENTHEEKYWKIMLGDSAERLKELDDQSIDLVVTSVPFPAMYSYTDSERDIGNYDNSADLISHLKYVFISLLPKMKPGRVVDIHLAQGVAHLNREGYIGLWDFRGPLIQMMTEAGFHWDGEWTIEKDPQTERARSNTLGLMQKTLKNDASHMRPSVADYLLRFYAPGKNSTPINALLAEKGVEGGNYDSPDGWITMPMWINWASNVWYKHRKGMKWWEGIDVTNVCGSLRKNGRQGYGVAEGKGKDDEKHLCELQLDVIERCIALHSAPGELVCDPFNGIGSTGFQALKMGRRYVGCELKESYYYTAIKNLQWIEANSKQQDLFSLIGENVEGDELLQRHQSWMNERGISIYDKATNWANWQTEMETE